MSDYYNPTIDTVTFEEAANIIFKEIDKQESELAGGLCTYFKVKKVGDYRKLISNLNKDALIKERGLYFYYLCSFENEHLIKASGYVGNLLNYLILILSQVKKRKNEIFNFTLKRARKIVKIGSSRHFKHKL